MNPRIGLAHSASPPFVHALALCESDDVGSGTRIWAFAQVMAGATVGSDCQICGGVFLESGAVLGDGVTVKNGVSVWDGVRLGNDVFVGPQAIFTNDRYPRARGLSSWQGPVVTEVGAGASLGAGATVIAGVRIGHHAMVGAGSIVTRDVPAHALVVGAPARARGWVCQDGNPLSADLTCTLCRRPHERRNGELVAS